MESAPFTLRHVYSCLFTREAIFVLLTWEWHSVASICVQSMK